VTGCAKGRSVLKSLADGQVWEVLVDFLVVNNFALELLHHLLLRDAVVVNNRLLIHLKAVHLAGHSLQQGTAP